MNAASSLSGRMPRAAARIAPYVAWVVGLVLLALLIPIVAVSGDSTYGGAGSWLLGLEIAGALAMLLGVTLSPLRGSSFAAVTVAAAWLLPEFAGWASVPEVFGTAVDAWSRLVPALVVVGLLAPPPSADSPTRSTQARRRLGVVVVLAAVATAAARLVLVDPFLDPDCWRLCGHNPWLIPGSSAIGPYVEGGAALLLAGGVVGCAVLELVAARAPARWPPPDRLAASGLALATAAPAVLRGAIPESALRAEYLVCFVVAQAAAVALATALAGDRWLQLLLSTRLAQLSVLLRSAPAPGALADALRAGVPDPRLEVRYWAPSRNEYVHGDGTPVVVLPPDAGDQGLRVTTVARAGQPVAALVHSPGVDGGRLDRALGAALRLALENEQLRAATLAELRELQASRARIVERAQEERRRLERNLHDGAQQRVVALALLVRMIVGQVSQDGDGAGALAGRAELLTRATVEELRRVARGIYPAVLADAGLVGALTDLSESSTDLPITVDVLAPGRYTGTVETTAYLVVAAALAEARSHGAGAARVCGRVAESVLRVEVLDGREPGARSGVTDLCDQVRALGGELIVGPHAGGTMVRLELPCGS